MPKEEKVELEGEVVEALPNAMFRVKLDNMDRVVLGHVAGKMRRFRIRILPGDRVRVELSPYDLDRARIVYRHRSRRTPLPAGDRTMRELELIERLEQVLAPRGRDRPGPEVLRWLGDDAAVVRGRGYAVTSVD